MRTDLHLHLLVATTGDTALHAAQACAKALTDHFSHIDITKLDASHGMALFGAANEQTAPKAFIVCSSTHGNGDVPQNGQAFLASFDLEPAFLGHVRYGLMALGDSSYGDTYGAGAKLIDAKLQDLGAQRIGKVFEHDASSHEDANQAATVWAKQWAKDVANHLAQTLA